jgi:hypothetical protein
MATAHPATGGCCACDCASLIGAIVDALPDTVAGFSPKKEAIKAPTYARCQRMHVPRGPPH